MLWKTIEGNIRLRLRVRFLLLYSELCPTGPWCNMLQTLIERKKIWGGNVRWILSIITLYESPKMEKNNKLRNKTNFRFVMKFLTFSCLKLATKPCLVTIKCMIITIDHEIWIIIMLYKNLENTELTDYFSAWRLDFLEIKNCFFTDLVVFC